MESDFSTAVPPSFGGCEEEAADDGAMATADFSSVSAHPLPFILGLPAWGVAVAVAAAAGRGPPPPGPIPLPSMVFLLPPPFTFLPCGAVFGAAACFHS